ncbi:hypothetical protein LAZ67_1004730 [Cordylochernes scorpioides]|uniref:RNA-directed DNA polymerase n=1 Tax=Cordylochernes scorpioides TaxID=51811 RepID=A0ABY6JZ46_9ARAC|nr:hypothetical protein LAZ67_1004730 [Cordylochernes scorpioides]
MTYLAKVRKCDLSKLAYELGEVVPPESRIVDLKRLILNSQSYEEEFAKQLLETLIEEREQTERAERERMEQTAQTEQAERIERERKEQMVMEFELEKLRIQTTRGNNDTSRSTSNDAHYEIRKLMPKYESKDNDLSFYLILFERQAKRLGLDEDQWAFSLLGLLPYEMTQLIARETEEQSGDYRFVKRLLLKRYKLSPEQFRQKFEKHERSQKGSWRDFAFELRGYFNEWIEGMNVENFDALKDLSVTNQLKKKVPNVLRNHLIDDWTKLNNPDELADKLDEYENVRTEMGPPHWNAKHLIPPSFQQKSARFPNQSEVKETKQGTNVSGQDAARNEISETYPNTLRRMVNRTIRNDKGEPKCFNCNQFGHIARDCPAPRTTLTCRGCGQTGHKERNCTRPKEGLKVANLEVEGLETVPPDVYLKDVKIDNKETVKAMIDTGSSSCLMRESVARRISVDIEPDSTSLYGIGNQTAPAARTVGKTTVDLEIDGIVGREITVFIVNDDAQPYDLLIGRTWTDLPYVSFARIGKNLHIGYSSEFPFANLQEEIKSRRIELRATETVQLESDSINFTSAITDEVKDGYVLFTGVDDACVDSLLEVVDGKTTVPIISAGKGKLRVRKNQCVGRVELLNLDDIVVNLDVAEDSFQTKNEEKREGQDQMKRKRPILPEDINVNHSLTSKERQEILDVVNEYRDCFALGMEELGCTDVTKMDIKEVDGSKPVCLRPYKTTASEREAIREIVREWKDNGIVTETRSPYASPVLLVRKKTGDHRLVVDYRRLNIQTVKDKFPLPRIDDLLEGLRNAKFFTTLDLAHGYLQIPLTDKAKLKTAFITPDDTGQFERMIFGLANAPAEFQRLMHTVLGPLLNKKAFCYLDDVIIPAKDWREMIERLREVLERIRSAKLTLKPSKCEFGRREVEFLGYVISTGGLKPGPRKIKAIEEFPEPKNVHDIRRFLGLTNFFRRFVKDFARKAEPLSRLTKKGSQFEWKEEQRRSFGGLRKDLVEYPVLAHYNPELKTEVHCDASAEGLAGMVLQMDEDCKWRLVYCVSKKTTEAEKMYHSSKLELMAIVWTLDRLRQFLVGIKFTVVTDCQALVYMNAKKTTNPQIARWYNLIQEYDFEIRHKPGEKMAHVDGMSRAPVDDPRDTMEEIVEKNLEVCLTITLEEQILMIQHSDPELRDLIQIFRKDPCDMTVGEQNRINDYSYRRKSGRGARSRRYPPTQPTTFLQRKVQSRTIEIQEWPNGIKLVEFVDGVCWGCVFFFLISTQSYQGIKLGIKLVEFVDGVCWGCVFFFLISTQSYQDRCCTDEVQPDQEPEPRDSLHPAQVGDPGSGGGVLSDAAGREPGGHPQCQSPQFHHHPAGSTGRISRHQEWNGQGARVDVTYVLLCVQLQYVFKKVFDDHVSQKDIFDHVAKPLVQDLIAGKNGRLGCPRGECADSWVVPGLLFTYGITSSGKTFTMTGVPRDAGILPRSLDVLFNSLKDQLARKFVRTLLLYTASFLSNSGTLGTSRVTIQEISLVFAIMAFTTWKKDADLDWSQRQSEECMVEGVDSDCVYGVFVSYVEIYNNYVYDLLEESGETGSKLLREDAGKRVYVFGATEVEVRNAGEAMEALCRGQIRRRVANTALNAESSRSHSIFSVRVVRCPLDARGAEPLPDKNLLTLAQLSLVDLAGSERTARTGTAGNRLKEASHDNHVHVVQAMIIMVGRSRRLFLLTCIEILRENQMENANKMVPYRESKLTHLFKSYFEGEGSIKMVVCVNPKPSDYDETIHVMKFAELTQEVLVERHAPPPTPQLQSGRGNRFREVARRVKEEAELQQLLTPAVYSLGPPFPDFTELTEESQFDTLIDILEQRYQSGKFLTKDLPAKQSELRKCIHETEKENLTMQQQFTVLQMNLEAREIQVRTLEKKLSSVEHSKDILSRKMEESERNQRNLKNLLEDRDMQIKQSSTESNKMKTKFQDRLAMEKERMNRIMEHRLAEKQAELESKMCLSEDKIRQLRDILNAGDGWELPEQPQTATTASETRLSSTRTQAGAALWVDHRPPGSLEMGTVLQPQMKKRRSVSKLQIKDFKDPEKYVLTHQEQDSQGEIETHLYKGDVIPSVSGGAQVIFNDVETLKQTSPTNAAKKRSYATPDVATIRADIESRVQVNKSTKFFDGLYTEDEQDSDKVKVQVNKSTKFFDGLYTEDEQDSDKVKCLKVFVGQEKEKKMEFLQKAIDVVGWVTGEPLLAKPSKIVAGHEPQRTNEFLQALGLALAKKLDSKEAVKKVLAGEKPQKKTHADKGPRTRPAKDTNKAQSRNKAKEASRKETKKASPPQISPPAPVVNGTASPTSPVADTTEPPPAEPQATPPRRPPTARERSAMKSRPPPEEELVTEVHWKLCYQENPLGKAAAYHQIAQGA